MKLLSIKMVRWRFGRLCLALLVFVSSVAPVSTLAMSETLPVQIRVQLNWNHRSGNIRSIGSFTVDVRGTAKLKKTDSDYLQYEPIDIQAISRYQERLIQEASGFPCSGQIIRRIEGSGITSIDSIYPDMDKGSLLIGINRGNAGKIAALQHIGAYNPMMLSKLDEMPPSDNYQVGLLVPLDVTYQQICSDHSTQKGKIPLYLVLFKDFTSGSMEGSYIWEGDEGMGIPSFKIDVHDVKGIRKLVPTPGKGAHYNVSWSFSLPQNCDIIKRERLNEASFLKAFQDEGLYLAAKKMGLEVDAYTQLVHILAMKAFGANQWTSFDNLSDAKQAELLKSHSWDSEVGEALMATDPYTCKIIEYWNKERYIDEFKSKIAGEAIYSAHRQHEESHKAACETSRVYRYEIMEIEFRRKDEIRAYTAGINEKDKWLKRLQCK